jgi:hypothetical protein
MPAFMFGANERGMVVFRKVLVRVEAAADMLAV